MTDQRITVVVNPAAGSDRGSKRARSVVGDLADRGYTVDLVRVRELDRLGPAIAEASQKQNAHIILAGGDGLIHNALPHLVDTDVTVGIIPTGTGNDFCRGLGLPTRRRDAIDAAVSAESTAVDLLMVADESGGPARYAASVLTCGFSGRVNGRANNMRFPRGSGRYTAATIAELPSMEPSDYQIQIDDGPVEVRSATLIAVGNTSYFGAGMAVCPDANFADGLLDVIIIDPVPASTFARVLPLVFAGRHTGHPAVHTMRVEKISLGTSEKLWADGESLCGPDGSTTQTSANKDVDANGVRPGLDCDSTVTVSARPGALRIAGVRSPAVA